METIAHKIHPARYEDVKKAVCAAESGDLPKAELVVQAILRALPESTGNPEAIQTRFFADALQARLNGRDNESGNLYLVPDQGQQIRMFNFMAEKFPLVRFSQELINAAYLDLLRQESNLIVMDIGIGTGQQIIRLMNRLVAAGSTPAKVTVLGIDPAAQSLTTARKALTEFTKTHGIALRFEPVNQVLEELDENAWSGLGQVIRECDGKLIINASFALHHVRPTALRSQIFKRLKQFQPSMLGIIEPYADFLTPNLEERFAHAWHHYGLTFGAIDRIDATDEEKNEVKHIFFRREIQDVLSHDTERTEQFETGEMWAERLKTAGFSIDAIPASESEVPGCAFVKVSRNPGYIGLNVDGFPIISILAAR